VWIERRKWKDDPHYGSEGVLLGEDEHGIWVGANPGNRMYKGTGSIVHGRYRLVWCIPRDGWFLAHYMDGHPEIGIYIDVAAPALWTERGAKLVDLDFDVVMWADGRPVELVDEDEFELHRGELAYPDDMVASARAAATRVFEQATAGEEPFAMSVAARWFKALEVLDPAPPPLL